MGCKKTLIGSLLLPGIGTMIGGQMDAADAQSKGIKDAAAASAQGTTDSITESRRQYNQTRDDFAPFRDLAPRSLATLESSIYGGSKDYIGPDGKPQTATGEQFDLAGFRPEKTDAFDWQKSRTLEDLGNYFNLVGRGKGSTVQSNTTARSLGDLNAREYESGYNRLFQRKQDYTNNLLNLVKTASGAAGNTAAMGGETSRDITGAIRYGADSSSNAALAEGKNKSDLYSGLSRLPIDLAGLAVQGGFKPFA